MARQKTGKYAGINPRTGLNRRGEVAVQEQLRRSIDSTKTLSWFIKNTPEFFALARDAYNNRSEYIWFTANDAEAKKLAKCTGLTPKEAAMRLTQGHLYARYEDRNNIPELADHFLPMIEDVNKRNKRKKQDIVDIIMGYPRKDK